MARADDPVAEAAGRFLRSFKGPTRLLVAISGGSDSTGLFVALATLCAIGRYPDISLSACTVDHDLRAGSADEASWVADLCARYGVPHVTRRWAGVKPSSGLQAAARAKRYALLVDAALETGADAILTAHTADDQTETIAMRAARAPEGVGLSGMADAALLLGSVWLLRPFLCLERTSIRSFLAGRGERWLEDPSNANLRFERVRVRNSEPNAEWTAVDRLSWSNRAADFLARHVRAEGPLFAMGADVIQRALSDAAAWRGLLVFAAAVGGRVHTLEAASAERLQAFLASGTLSRLTAGRVVFDRRREGLFVYREHRGIDTLVLQAGETALWDGRYRITNRTDRTVVVSAAGNGQGVARVGLHGPALRASRAAPRLNFEDGSAVPQDMAHVERSIAPYAAVLPRFDLPLAAAIAEIFQCPRFPSPPNG